MTQRSKERRSKAAKSGSGKATGTATSRKASRWGQLVRQVKDGWHRLLALDAFWVVLFLAIGTWALTPRAPWTSESVSAGGIADRTFVAPSDDLVLDYETTEEKRRRAREEVLAVYDFDPAAAIRLTDSIRRAFEIGREHLADEAAIEESGEEREGGSAADAELAADAAEGAPTPLEEMLGRITTETGLKLTDEQLGVLADKGFTTELEDRLDAPVESALERGVVAGKSVLLEHRSRGITLRNLQTGDERRQLDLYGYLDYSEDVESLVGEDLRDWRGLSKDERAVVVELLLSNLSPNLHFNQSETLRRQEVAAAAIEDVYNRISQGQVIVRKGDQIDARTAKVINELAGQRGLRALLLPMLGTFLFLALVVLVLWLGVAKERVAQTRRKTAHGEVLLLLLVTLLATRLCHLLATGLGGAIGEPPLNAPQIYYFAVPFAAFALLTVILYGRGLALLAALAYSLLAGVLLEEASWNIVVYCMAGSLAAILAVDHYQFKQRSITVRAGAIVAGVNAVTVLMLAAISGSLTSGSRLAVEVLCALAGGVLVAAVVSLMVPVLESVYGLTTGIKLVELANTNLPLLRRLAFEAPGTFQHSLMVANLAKSGCEAIGADSVLAYTGALYHDIGKMIRPEYFVENQRPGQNRHDKLLPSMSALIIINHVKEGIEMAREYHLPQPIVDAIAEHHGNRLISFFYNRAKEMHDPESGELSEDKFRYPGPKPQSKVMGVMMLADGVEAASRTLVDPSPASLRSLIERIVDDCLGDGQLDETDLTLGDLKRVSEAFQTVLTHIHHRRIDYPGFDFNAKKERQRREGQATPAEPLPAGEPVEAEAEADAHTVAN